MSLDIEETSITFNGKIYDITENRDLLTQKSDYLRVLLDECGDEVSITTDVVKSDTFEKVIDLVLDKEKEIDLDQIKDISLAFNYLAIDKNLVEGYYTTLKTKIKYDKLDIDTILSVINQFTDISKIEECFYGYTDEKEYHQLLEDIKKKVGLDRFVEIYNVWRKRYQPADLEHAYYVDFVPRFKDKDRVFLNLYDFDLTYQAPIDPHLRSETKFQEGDSVILPQEDALKRFHDGTYGILKELDYDGIFVAGGYVLYSTSPHLERKNSDVDIFVYGDTEWTDDLYDKYGASYCTPIGQTTLRLIKYFQKYAKDNNKRIFFAKQWRVITVCIEDIDINFQIVETNNSCLAEVIDTFGLDYIQLVYDGKDFLCYGDTLKALKYQTVFSEYDEKRKEHMYLKAYDKGFSLFHDNKKDMEEIRKDPLTAKKLNSYFYPSTGTEKEILSKMSKRFRTNQVFFDERPHENAHTDHGYGDDDYEDMFITRSTPNIVNKDEMCKNITVDGFYRIYENNKLIDLWYAVVNRGSREIKIVLPVLKGVYYGRQVRHKVVVQFDEESKEVIDFIRKIELKILEEVNFKNLPESVRNKIDDARENIQESNMFGSINIDKFKTVVSNMESRNTYQGQCFNFVGQLVIYPHIVWVNESGKYGVKFKVCEVKSFEITDRF